MRFSVYYEVTTKAGPAAAPRKRFSSVFEGDAVRYAKLLNTQERRGSADAPFADVHELPVMGAAT